MPAPKPVKVAPSPAEVPSPPKSKLEPAKELIRYQQIIDSEKPTYAYLGFDTERGGHVWKVETIDQNGAHREGVGSSRDRQKAKQNAATNLLGQLPQLPSKGEGRRIREAAAKIASDESAANEGGETTDQS